MSQKCVDSQTNDHWKSLSLSTRSLNFKRLFLLSWQHKAFLIGGMISTVLSVLTQMVFPILIGIVINALTYDHYQAAITGPMIPICDLSPWNCYENQLHLLHTGVCTVILIGLSSALFAFARWYSLEVVGERMVSQLRNQLFHSILFAEPGMFDTVKTGELINRLTADTMELKTVCTAQLAQIIHSSFNVLVSIFYVFYVSWFLTLVLLTVVPFVAVSGRLFGIYNRSQSRISQDLLAQSTGIAAESISNIRTVKALSIEQHEEYRFAAAIYRTYEQGMKMTKLSAAFSAANNMMTSASMTLVVWYGMKQVIDGELSAGDLGTYVMMAMNIGGALSQSVGLYNQIMKALGAGERTFKLIDRQSAIPPFGGKEKISSTVTPYSYHIDSNQLDLYCSKWMNGKRGRNRLQYIKLNQHEDSELEHESTSIFDEDSKSKRIGNADTFRGEIVMESVHFMYPSRPTVKVLDDVNITITSGQITALVGESGGGKSSIIQLLLRFYDPNQGVIRMDGIDLKQYDLRWLHRNIGYVSQEPVLFARSIRENIVFGVEHEDSVTMDRIHDAAKKANAYDFIMEFPQKFETKVGERGTRLSGGQKQRVAIARAILNDPKILLLDEATSALDTESEHLVQKALDRIISEGNKTVIVIAHRLSTVKNADRILVVQRGKVVEKGKHEDLIAKNGIYSNLVQQQMFTTTPT